MAAQHAQHHDEAAGSEAAGVVVGNDDGVVADAKRAHRGGKRLGGRERMTTLGGGEAVRGECVVEVDPDGTGDVGLFECCATVATVEIPAHIGDHQVRVIEPGNGFRGDDRGDHGQHPASTFA